MSGSSMPYFKQKFKFYVEYPFKFDDQILYPYLDCKNETGAKQRVVYPMDCSLSAQFFVATGVLSFLYSNAALILYIFGHQYYETHPWLSVIDLAGTGLLTILWLASTCVWTASVNDVRDYASPENLWTHFDFCNGLNVDNEASPMGQCYKSNPGKWTSLNTSFIFGFVNIFLWAVSVCFVFKETQLYKKYMANKMATKMAAIPDKQQHFVNQIGGQPSKRVGK